jgi:hypothetical protein
MENNYIVPPLAKDKVQSFGYKCAWIAVRTEDMGAVIDTLGIRELRPGSWVEGVAYAYNGGVFVTNPLRGYVLSASCAWPEPPTGAWADEITPILERLARRFDDVQYFYTYRVVEGHAWARLKDGKRLRAFAVSDFQKLWDIGSPTEAEAKLDLTCPTEEDVMKVAGQWSIDPSKLENMNLDVTQGILGLSGGSL